MEGSAFTICLMAAAGRIAISGLLVLCALAFPAGAAAGAGPAHASVGFEPIPLSVAADGAGHVYLSNPLSSTVQQYSSDGELLADLGSFTPSSNPFLPREIATDAAGALYVFDGSSGEISVLGADGSTLRHWSAHGGRDLAVGGDGSVYLAASHEVERFSSDGALLSKWGGSALEGGPFGEIWGIDTSPSGLVYVADTYGNQIQVYMADGTFVREWGGSGPGDGEFHYPYGIATNAAGEVYVADTVNDRVQRFSASGAFLGAWGGSDRGHGRFYTPTSVATDPAGYVYVADRVGPYPEESYARVQKFTGDGRFVTQWYDHQPHFTPGPPRLSASVGRKTAVRFVVFQFHSPSRGVRFACRLSGTLVPAKLRKWRSCSSPKHYYHLRPGRKIFHVRAIKGDAVGSEAKHSWLVVGSG